VSDQANEQETKKRAIFDGMSQRGRERVLRMGYENWDPFQEPKDPRERIRGSLALQVDGLLREFLAVSQAGEGARAFITDLQDLCTGLLRQDRRAQVLSEFCLWLRERSR
jgi:hypothetical protein